MKADRVTKSDILELFNVDSDSPVENPPTEIRIFAHGCIRRCLPYRVGKHDGRVPDLIYLWKPTGEALPLLFGPRFVPQRIKAQ